MTVGIIGAGPAGCFLGAKLKWDDAVIFEKKKTIGTPIACTGIVTDSIYRVIDKLPEEIKLNYIDTFRIESPEGKHIDVKLKKKNIIMDRAGFDQHIASLARNAGTPIKTGYALKGWKRRNGKYVLFFENGEQQEVNYIVGADGPKSPTSRISNIYGKREILEGYQARVEIKKKEQAFEPHITDVLFGLGEFAWIVPENERIARVGIIGKNTPQQNIREEFLKLVKPYKHLEDQSGTIPMYNPKQVMQKGNLALIGDAATQVKATTYGGIIYGMIAASYLGEEWDNYEQKFRNKLGKDLWVSLKMREIMNKLSEKECNELIHLFENEEARAILAKSDRNFPTKFLLKLLMKETKLWKYGFKLFSK